MSIIDKGEIVRAALDILRVQGLDAVSTRKLAEVLKVRGPALYHHYKNKQELLGDMANAIVSVPVASIDPSLPWDAWSAAFAVAVRKAILPYPDGARLLIAAWPSNEMREQTIPRIEAPLIAAGFNPERSHEVTFLIASAVIGWMLNEQNPRIREFMEQRFDLEHAFVRAVETILDGIRSQMLEGRS
ncbi:TetR family transcriptional regulator [Rhizorhabdus dicambivorans]|uniref:TetR family transcriptional regulator n=1 Tax=Rhizorhabdus dicambivorans TaxID=1850238 RepID=UPI001596C89E|nr:TetR family transcriptional regulator [Rhizorhabdus dicambivorans]